MSFESVTHTIVLGIEICGVAVIVLGVVAAVVYGLAGLVRDRELELAYNRVRHGIGRALMLGLDLLIASEIMRSILVDSLESVAVLGLTIVVRTFLSLTLTVEIEGRVPWKRKRPSSEEDDEG